MSDESHDRPDHPSTGQPKPARQTPDALPLKTGDGGGLNPADERNLWTGRTSWKHSAFSLLGWAFFSILVVVAGLWIRAQGQTPAPWTGWLIVALIVLPGLYVGFKVFVKVYSVRYRLTTQRLFIERGILARTTDQTELIRVDDVRVHKSLSDRIFGIGTVEVVSTDATDAKILVVGVEIPDRIAEHVRTNMRILRKHSLYVESI